MSVTDNAIQDALSNLSPKERAALAVKLDVTERTVSRWAKGESPIESINAHVRAALEKALSSGGKR